MCVRVVRDITVASDRVMRSCSVLFELSHSGFHVSPDSTEGDRVVIPEQNGMLRIAIYLLW